MSGTNGHSAPAEPVYNRNPDGTFGPGNNANPGGRPKPIFTRAGLAELRDGLAKDADPDTHARALMAALRAQALAGDVAAARLYIETIQGKPPQETELSGSVASVMLRGVDV